MKVAKRRLSGPLVGVFVLGLAALPAAADPIGGATYNGVAADGASGSPGNACRGSRTVILWRGSRRFSRTKTKANGSFWFTRSAQVRGKPVRASVLARTVRAGKCAAGSLVFIKA